MLWYILRDCAERAFTPHPPPSAAKESPVKKPSKSPSCRVAKATTAAGFAGKKPKETPAVVLDRHGVVMGADPRSIAKARALTASIARHKEALAADFYALGQDLAARINKQLYRKVYGFATVAEFLEAKKLYAPTQAYKFQKPTQPSWSPMR